MPKTRVLKVWKHPRLPFQCNVKVYSFKRAGDTYTSDPPKAFFTAFSGIPSKANAETSTPVSTTTLFLFSVGFSPYCLNRIINILQGQARIPECLPCELKGCIQAVPRRKYR